MSPKKIQLSAGHQQERLEARAEGLLCQGDQDLSKINGYSVFQVKYLEKADLSSNLISFIEEGTFRNLVHLKTLDLSNNKCAQI